MRLIVILTIISLLWSVSAISQEPCPPSAERQPRKIETKNTTETNVKPAKNKNATTNPLPLIDNNRNAIENNPPSKKPNYENRKHQEAVSNNDPTVWYNFLMMIFTGALVICNILLWVYTKKTADAATASERAFFHITICSDNIKEATPIHHVRYQIRNYGKTLGILREISHSIKWGKEFHGTQHYLPMDVIIKDRIISENSSTEDITCAVNDSEDFIKNVEIFRRETCAWFYGRIVYDDIFGSTHEHRFLWKSSINTKAFFPCYETAYKHYNINT